MKKESFKYSVLLRVLAFLLLLAISTGVLASCKNDPKPNEDGTESNKQGEVTTEPDTGTQEPVFDEWNPDEDLTALDYNKATVRFLQCEYKATEFYSENGASTDIVEKAVYERNAAVEEDLNILFDFVTVANPSSGVKILRQAVEESIQAASESTMYHIVANPAYYTSAFITEGLYLDYNSIENNYVNTDKGYWSSNYVEEQLLNNKYYFLVGDLCTSTIERLLVMFVNNDLAEDYFGDEDLYELVYNNQWTYEKMLELIAYAADGDSNGTYGLAVGTNSYSIDGFLAGFDLDMLERNASGIPSVKLNTAHNFDIVTALRELYYENTAVSSGSNATATTKFSSQQAIFTVNMLSNASAFKDAGVKYSILPTPMWNAEQKDYLVTTHDQYTGLSICSNVKDASMLTAVLESMAYHSHDTVYEAVYEKTYRLRYNESQKEADMFDFIYGHLYYSMGAIYSYVLGEVKNTPRYLLYPDTNTWVANRTYPIQSTLTTLEDTVETQLEEFLDYLYGEGTQS